jgi:hypothetical protein
MCPLKGSQNIHANQMFRCSIYRQKYRVPFKSRLGAKFIWNFSPAHASITYWTVYTYILHSFNITYWTVYTSILHPSLNSLHIYSTPFTEQSTHLSHTLTSADKCYIWTSGLLWQKLLVVACTVVMCACHEVCMTWVSLSTDQYWKIWAST